MSQIDAPLDTVTPIEVEIPKIVDPADAGSLSDDDTDDSYKIKVSALSNPRLSAGSIAHAVRRGEAPRVICTGLASLNQAIKAIAIARTFLATDKINIVAIPSYRDAPTRLRMVFKVCRGDDVETQSEETADLRVAQASKFPVVAGAIAKKVRSQETPYIISIGASAVAVAVLSIIRARFYLKQDTMDVVFRPHFVHVDMDGEKRSALRFAIFAREA